MTALHWAADGGHDEIAKQIFENVGNANANEILVLVRDSGGCTVLDTCIQNDFCGDRVHDAHIVPYFSEAGRLC